MSGASYRYGPISIGFAESDSDSLRESARRIMGAPDLASLEIWTGSRYVSLMTPAIIFESPPCAVFHKPGER
jgi:hypothetical protein